ncbi:response regulator transcription factor [Kribbella sp. NPDC026596]|uniref:response regulator transcription factor n=1 Tax=Kribbella sp. NPDC026596 TaxID=3155122 RepID=UPI0033E5B5AF
MIRVLVADDHPVFRRGLVGVLTEEPGIDVVAEAPDGDTTIALAAELRPDVVLMDLHMAGTGGIAATRRLTAEVPDVAVLVLTMLDDEESVQSALHAGARGYLVKGASGDRILDAVRAVADGEIVFGADVAGLVLGRLTADRKTTRTGPFPMLTDREVEVLTLIGLGRSNTEIARRLVVSDKTVRNHITNIFAKLGVADRAQAIVRARDAGLC